MGSSQHPPIVQEVLTGLTDLSVLTLFSMGGGVIYIYIYVDMPPIYFSDTASKRFAVGIISIQYMGGDKYIK